MDSGTREVSELGFEAYRVRGRPHAEMTRYPETEAFTLSMGMNTLVLFISKSSVLEVHYLPRRVLLDAFRGPHQA